MHEGRPWTESAFVPMHEVRGEGRRSSVSLHSLRGDDSVDDSP